MNRHFDCTCSHPHFLFNRFGLLDLKADCRLTKTNLLSRRCKRSMICNGNQCSELPEIHPLYKPTPNSINASAVRAPSSTGIR